MATVTKRGSTYRIRVSCGYDQNGRQIVHSRTWSPAPGMTTRQIEKELDRQKVLFEEECSGIVRGGSVKFADYANEWMKFHAEKELKASTVSRYRRLLPTILTAIGHIRLEKLNPLHIQRMIDNLGENGINRTTGKTLAPKTIGHYLSLTSAICADAAAKHLIKENPCRGIKLSKADHKERVIFTLEEAQTFLRALSQEPLVYQAFFVLAIYGGFRKGELLGLEWKDVDTDHRLISIRRAALFTHEDGHYIDTPKTEKSVRVLKLPAEVFPLLLQWKEQQQQERQACGDRWQVSDRIFTGTDGRPTGNSTPLHVLNRICDRAHLKRVNIHSLRHLNASLLIASGADVRTVSALLGHSNTTTTLNIYAHSFAEQQAKASEAVASVLSIKQA